MANSLQSLVNYVREQQKQNAYNPYPKGTPTLAARKFTESELPYNQARIREVVSGITGYDPETQKPTLQREEYEWQKPWQEKAWQREINAPYAAGGSTTPVSVLLEDLRRKYELADALNSFASRGVDAIYDAPSSDKARQELARLTQKLKMDERFSAKDRNEVIKRWNDTYNAVYPAKPAGSQSDGSFLEQLKNVFTGGQGTQRPDPNEALQRVILRG